MMFTAIAAVLLSFTINRDKTVRGLKKGATMLAKFLPQFVLLFIFVSVLLGFLSQETLARYLGSESGFFAVVIAAIIGSIALIPGAVAYPLSSALVEHGVSYTVIGVFITTLMMVGILTFPIERKYFGLRISLVRNSLSFLGALAIGTVIGVLM
jgi:uncharacterized membrane protein YraQ (UPF0718 family)